MGFMKNKKILITGLSNKFSIAYGIAKSMYKQNAKLAFSYQSERIKEKVKKIAKKFDSSIILKCDVSSDKSIELFFSKLEKKWNNFDGFVHSIAYAPSNQLDGDFLDTITREGFKTAHDISSYSFVALAKRAKKLLNPFSSIITLTYLGSSRTVSNYNVMGLAKASLEANIRYMAKSMGNYNIRVNGISSGPIKTTASCGIKNFRKMLSSFKKNALLKKNITSEDVGNCAAFLCSNLSNGITGEIIYVDYGFNISIPENC